MKIYHYTPIKIIENEINGTKKEIILNGVFCDILYNTKEELSLIIEELKIKHECSIIDIAVHENDNFKLK